MSWEWLEFETTRFEMGFDEDSTRSVTVGSLAIISRCVTVRDFAVFVEATGYRTTAQREGTGWVSGSTVDTGSWVAGADWQRPLGGEAVDADTTVVQISWHDCHEFCRWSGTLLPTEAQWARVALDEADVAPGVWQWCADYYHPTYFRSEQQVNPTGPNGGTERVLRGGGDVAAQRAHHLPDFASDRIGFRVLASRQQRNALPDRPSLWKNPQPL